MTRKVAMVQLSMEQCWTENGFYKYIESYVKESKEKGLTHLVIDEHKNRNPFFHDVFDHEENYPYLSKVFDSSEYGYRYHVKIFKIDYSKFNSNNS